MGPGETQSTDHAGKSVEFKRLAASKRTGVVAEFWGMVRDNKKWWLLPIVGVILVVGLLVFLGASGAAPFIYTLF